MISHQSQTRHSIKDGGFTLIELIGVLVILAVLVAAAVPAMQSLSSSRRALGASELLHDVSYARRRAVATGTTHWVTLDVAADQYAILIDDTANPGIAGARPLPDPSDGRPLVRVLNVGQFEGVQIISAAFDGASSVGFDWLGRPLETGGAPLVVSGSISLTGGHLIEVETRTGYVRHVEP